MKHRALSDNSVSYIRNLAVGGTADELGGKGYRLAQLYRSGFPVPDGFVLTTHTFDVFLNQRRQDAAGGDGLPPTLRESIKTSYRRVFGSAPVVVRSSATAEDSPEASFAGVFRSIADVKEASLVDAVMKVYDSLSSTQAIEYFRSHCIDPSSIRMAVIIQRQVEPTLSGVCFTANPVTGVAEYVIEFVRGRSEAMLQGQQQPFRVVFDRNYQLLEASFRHSAFGNVDAY